MGLIDFEYQPVAKRSVVMDEMIAEVNSDPVKLRLLGGSIARTALEEASAIEIDPIDGLPTSTQKSARQAFGFVVEAVQADPPLLVMDRVNLLVGAAEYLSAQRLGDLQPNRFQNREVSHV